MSIEGVVVLIGKEEQISYGDDSLSHNLIWVQNNAVPEGKWSIFAVPNSRINYSNWEDSKIGDKAINLLNFEFYRENF
jgi:hypothetical protein